MGITTDPLIAELIRRYGIQNVTAPNKYQFSQKDSGYPPPVPRGTPMSTTITDYERQTGQPYSGHSFQVVGEQPRAMPTT